VSKLYPLELSEENFSTTAQDKGSQGDSTTANNLDCPPTNNSPHCDAAQCARQRLTKWTEIIRVPWRMLEITSHVTLTL